MGDIVLCMAMNSISEVHYSRLTTGGIFFNKNIEHRAKLSFATLSGLLQVGTTCWSVWCFEHLMAWEIYTGRSSAWFRARRSGRRGRPRSESARPDQFSITTNPLNS